MLGGLARGGHHLEAGLGQQRHRGASDAARCAGDQNGPVAGCRPVVHETPEGKESGAAGQADDGGGARAQGVRQRDDPVGRDPGVGGKPAVPVHPEVVALHQDALPRGEVGARALLDASGELHPGDEWEDPRHPVAGPGHHGVLEVDGGPLDPDQDLTRGKVGVGELDHRGPDDRPRLGEQVGRETHSVTVEGRAGCSGRGPMERVRSDRDHDCRVRALGLAARGG